MRAPGEVATESFPDRKYGCTQQPIYDVYYRLLYRCQSHA